MDMLRSNSRKTFLRTGAIALSTFLFVAGPGAKARVTLKIQRKKPVSKVSPMLYGLMTEEINYSYDGGLYAEMVRNRMFRARRRDVPYWVLVEDGNAQAKIEADQQAGPSEALNYS